MRSELASIRMASGHNNLHRSTELKFFQRDVHGATELFDTSGFLSFTL
jgi:hypothetical protein